MNANQQPPKPQSFRLAHEDNERLEQLAAQLGCSKTEVIRKALIALRVGMADGYDFEWAFGPGLVLRHVKEGKTTTTTWFTLEDDDRLKQIGQQTAEDITHLRDA